MRVATPVAVTKATVLLVTLMSCSAGSARSQAAVDQALRRASICSLMAAPKTYAGKTVEVVGRITAVKEGIDMWDPSCRDL
jgi:hypothetical protein